MATIKEVGGATGKEEQSQKKKSRRRRNRRRSQKKTATMTVTRMTKKNKMARIRTRREIKTWKAKINVNGVINGLLQAAVLWPIKESGVLLSLIVNLIRRRGRQTLSLLPPQGPPRGRNDDLTKTGIVMMTMTTIRAMTKMKVKVKLRMTTMAAEVILRTKKRRSILVTATTRETRKSAVQVPLIQISTRIVNIVIKYVTGRDFINMRNHVRNFI